MLLANILVAETLFDNCKDRALLRSHADIVENKKNELGNFFKKIGLDQINFTDALSLSQSIAQLEQEPDSEDKLTVVNRKFITNLTQAKYVCVENKDPEDFSHYGLNFSLYTHFTSPIRRYADLLVHRLLTICLKEKENTRDKMDGLDYSEYAEIISEQSYNSRKASKECQTLFHCFLLKE
jgi:exoribonuclease R